MSLIATDKRSLVVGLGITGLSCVRFLKRQGVSVAVADSRENPPNLATLRSEFPDVPVHLGAFDGDLFKQFQELVVSPGISVETPAIVEAIESGAYLTGDVDIFSQLAAAPIIAITGSNGKSTVTTLVGEMAKAEGLRVAVGGNLGTPVLDLLDESVELYVLELSSFQLETTQRLGAWAATVLNISDDHLDRYHNRMAYHQAKHRIFRGCRYAIVNDDEPLSAPLMAAGMEARHFSLSSPNLQKFSTTKADGSTWLTWSYDKIFDASRLRVKGHHNVSNCLAALALGQVAGLQLSSMITALEAFDGLPHRCQLVRQINGVDFVDDSKGTNVGASVTAIRGLQGRGKVILIAGGEGKGADFSPLHAAVADGCRAVVLIGRDAPIIRQALGTAAPMSDAASLADAVHQAAALAQPGDTVLLSPACASFDMFKDYVDRGEQFRALVNQR